MNRRTFLVSSAGVLGLAAAGCRMREDGSATAAEPAVHFEFELTDDQWRERLGPRRYAVLRQHGTEPAFSSPLDHEHRAGVYHCGGCELALYSSTTKFDSGTGWPSFWQPLPDAVATRRDTSLMMVRTEVHCRRCGGHLGHVFDDGPRPTGLRYCMNGLSLHFVPATA
jgi:peptide-methionine (R)-S-oxide reductase